MHNSDLEDYLRTAGVRHVAPLAGGGGHQSKQLLVLDGGLGVVAKLAEGSNPIVHGAACEQVRSEVAAWFLAQELGWDDLVPVTTLGVVESRLTGNHVAASLQIAWPRFNLAAELQREPATCTEADRWRIAIFDALAGNTDRNATNWGFIQDLQRAKLIDHGNGFGTTSTTSEFATQLTGHKIPKDYIRYLEAFVANKGQSRIPRMLPPDKAHVVFERAQLFVQRSMLSI